jgi:hypothetical protein
VSFFLRRSPYFFAEQHALVSCSADNPPASNKKTKKNALKNAQAASLDPSDQAALNRRAQRFQREHDIARQKNTGNGGGYGGGFNKANNSYLFRDRVPSGSASPWGAGGYDDPEADPVCIACYATLSSDKLRPECAKLGSIYHRGDKSGSVQRLFASDNGMHT